MQRANRACRTQFVAIAPYLKLNCHICKSLHDARFATDLCVIPKRAYDEPETKYTNEMTWHVMWIRGPSSAYEPWRARMVASEDHCDKARTDQASQIP